MAGYILVRLLYQARPVIDTSGKEPGVDVVEWILFIIPVVLHVVQEEPAIWGNAVGLHRCKVNAEYLRRGVLVGW